MIDVFLGLVALATLTTALVELVVIVGLVRIGLRLTQRVNRIRRLARPLAVHAAEVGENMSRARSLADAQLDRVVSAYAAVEVPLGRVMTAFAVARGVATAVRRLPRRARRQRK